MSDQPHIRISLGFDARYPLHIVADETTPPKVGAWVTLHLGPYIVKGQSMAYSMPSHTEVGATIAYTDAAGNPATVDGVVAWSSSNASVVSVVAAGADGMTATISAPGPIGQAQITATADADLGSGVKTLLTFLDVAVVAGEAVAGVITPGDTPTPIP